MAADLACCLQAEARVATRQPIGSSQPTDGEDYGVDAKKSSGRGPHVVLGSLLSLP